MGAPILGIIPARGGSKGVRRKNIRPVAGKPLISYTIEAAQHCSCLTHFVVSTDDPEIAEVSHGLGAPVLMRPAELAADTSPMVPVVQHAIASTTAPNRSYEYVVLLQPTAPLRTSEDIDAAVSLLIQSEADSVVSVYKVGDHHPSRMYRQVHGRLVAYDTEPHSMLRQHLPIVYHRNGAIYACRRALVETEGTLLGGDLRGFLMPRSRSVNIDEEIDLAFVEFLLVHRTDLLTAPGGIPADDTWDSGCREHE